MTLAIAALVLSLVQAPPQDPPKGPDVPQAPPGLKIGDVVPDIAMKTLDGKELKLSDFRGEEKGQVVVIYFQSEKCPSALPPAEVKKIAEPWTKEESKVKFIAINAYHHDSEPAMKKFYEKHALAYPAVWDKDYKVTSHLGTKQVNATYVLDKEGKLVYRGAFLSKKAGVLVEQAVKAAQGEGTAPASDGRFAG